MADPSRIQLRLAFPPVYLGGMPVAINMELPPEVARRFVSDMEAFHAESDPIKRDAIRGDHQDRDPSPSDEAPPVLSGSYQTAFSARIEAPRTQASASSHRMFTLVRSRGH
jgi:hypothetical protein